MNLQKMFEMQAELDRRIIKEKGLEGQDLLPGLILALQVELAECANEWRGFKFWSNDQQPREEKLLEEYADCLHFILSIGNDIGYSSSIYNLNILKWNVKKVSGVNAFLSLFKGVSSLITGFEDAGMLFHYYRNIFNRFNELGIALGFTPEQIEAAYMDKNEVNHKRQQEGY
ncbi:MAG: dUTP diphosphatase [Bacillota bacterium]